MSQFNLRYVPTLSCNELILNGYRFNTQGANINGNLTNPLTTEIIINDDTKNQKLYEDIIGLQGEIVGNINPNLVVVNQRLTALEGNVAILQGNVLSLEGNINTLEGDVVNLQNQIDVIGNIEQGLVGNTQYLIAPYNGLAGNTSFFYKGLQVYNTPGLAINETSGTGIFSYLDGAGPTGQIQHRVQSNREFQIKNGTTRINPSTNSSFIVQTTDNTPFNFVVGNSLSTYEQQYQTSFKVNSNVAMGFSDVLGGTTGLNIKNVQTSIGPITTDTLTSELNGTDVNVYSSTKLNVYNQSGGGLNIQSNVSTLSGGVATVSGGSGANLTSIGTTNVSGSSTNITSTENTNIFSNNGKRIDINCDVGSQNSEINIGTLQTTAQTGFQKITIGSQPTIPFTTAQTSTFVEGDLYRPFPISFNFPYDQMLYIGLPTPFSGPTKGPVKSTVNPFVRSLNAFAPDFTNNSFIQASGTFTVTVGVGAIVMNCGAGGFALNVVAGPLALTSLVGGVACTTGAGAIALTSGTGTIQISTGAAPIQQETVFGDILLKAGYAAAATPETALGSIYLKARNYTYITPDQAVVVGANVEAPFNEVLINTINYPFFGNLLTPPGLNGNSVFSNVFLTPNVKNSLVNPLSANLFYRGNVIGQTGSAQAFILYANNTVVTFSSVATVPYKGILEGNVIQGNIEPTRFTFDTTTELPLNANLIVRIAPTTLLNPNLELSRYGYGTWQNNTSIQSNIGVFLNGFVEPPVPNYDRYLTVLNDASFLNDVECNSNILVKKDAFPLKNTTITNDSVFTTGNVTCNTLNYTTLNPPIVSPNIPVLQRGGLITNNGSVNVAFPNPGNLSNVNTTSTLVDWTLLTVGSTQIFTLTTTPNQYITTNKTLRIRYNLTDFLDGIVRNVVGNNITLEITAFSSAGYSRTNVLSNGTTLFPTYVSSTGPFQNQFGQEIPLNSFVWSLQLNFLSNSTPFPGIPSTIRALLIGPGPTTVGITVNFTAPPGILFNGPILGFQTGTSILYNSGGFAVQYQYVSGSTLLTYGIDSVDGYFLGVVRGFTVPYSSGTVEILTPLFLQAKPTTSTFLDWNYTSLNNSSSTVVNTNSNGFFFPLFCSGDGEQILRDTTSYQINPFSGDLNLVDTFKITQNEISLGKLAGNTTQGENAIAIGVNSGRSNQGENAVAIGTNAGQIGQSSNAIAIGNFAGNTSQGGNCIAIGNRAGITSQSANSIIINASGVDLNAITTGLFINPIRNGIQSNIIGYDFGTKELTYFPSTITTATNINVTDTNTNATFYPTFVSGSGSQVVLADISTGAFSLNPSNGDFNVVDTVKVTQASVAIGKNTNGVNASGAVAIGVGAANTNQGTFSVAIGQSAGGLNQASSAVAIGISAGTQNQEAGCVAIGNQTGNVTQRNGAVAIGGQTGQTNQGGQSVAIGVQAGNDNQGFRAVAIGSAAAFSTQGTLAVAIGYNSGNSGQLESAVAIGSAAGQTTQGLRAIAIGLNAGGNIQSNDAVAIGHTAGRVTQGLNSVAVGNNSGNNNQGASAVAIGNNAGQGLTLGQGANSVSVGHNAGQTSQGVRGVAIGFNAGNNTQSADAVAIGHNAGNNNQAANAVAIGNNAGRGTTSAQGANAIAIGNNAGVASQTAGSICLNASGVALNPNQAGLFIDPIRNVDVTDVVGYNPTTKELTYFNETSLFGVGSPVLYNPIISDVGGNINSGAYNIRISEYIKIGKLVFYQGNISITAKTGLTGANGVRLSIPFTSDNTSDFIQTFNVGRMNGMIAPGIVSVSGSIAPNTDFMSFFIRTATSVDAATMLVSDISATWSCRFGGFYISNA